MKNENICTHDIEKFRDRIEGLRGDTPQEEFCRSIGVSRRTYQNWLNPLYKNYDGTYSYTLPKIETALKICDKYGVSLDFLFGRIDRETIDNERIHEITGLDDNAVKSLQACNLGEPETMPHINFLIGSMNICVIASAFKNLISPTKTIFVTTNPETGELMPVTEKTFKQGGAIKQITFSDENALSFGSALIEQTALNQITSCFKSLREAWKQKHKK